MRDMQKINQTIEILIEKLQLDFQQLVELEKTFIESLEQKKDSDVLDMYNATELRSLRINTMYIQTIQFLMECVIIPYGIANPTPKSGVDIINKINTYPELHDAIQIFQNASYKKGFYGDVIHSSAKDQNNNNIHLGIAFTLNGDTGRIYPTYKNYHHNVVKQIRELAKMVMEGEKANE